MFPLFHGGEYTRERPALLDGPVPKQAFFAKLLLLACLGASLAAAVARHARRGVPLVLSCPEHLRLRGAVQGWRTEFLDENWRMERLQVWAPIRFSDVVGS